MPPASLGADPAQPCARAALQRWSMNVADRQGQRAQATGSGFGHAAQRLQHDRVNKVGGPSAGMRHKGCSTTGQQGQGFRHRGKAVRAKAVGGCVPCAWCGCGQGASCMARCVVELPRAWCSCVQGACRMLSAWLNCHAHGVAALKVHAACRDAWLICHAHGAAVVK
eukprot:351788-Chlamydomonas_euryale.AAC.2